MTGYIRRGLIAASVLALLHPRYSPATPCVSEEDLQSYLQDKDSQLASNVQSLVRWGEFYDVDPRLIVAIAGHEFCFAHLPCADQSELCANHNTWGIMKNGACKPYPTWDDAIKDATRLIRELYFDTWGRHSIELIGLKWCCDASTDPSICPQEPFGPSGCGERYPSEDVCSTWPSGAGWATRVIGFYRCDLDGNTADLTFEVCQTPGETIVGRIYNDHNGDRTYQVGEELLQNWHVRLSQGGTDLQTVTTDENGQYEFTNLAPGSYRVSIPVMSAGYVLTSPANPTGPAFRDVTIPTASSVDFGVHGFAGIWRRSGNVSACSNPSSGGKSWYEVGFDDAAWMEINPPDAGWGCDNCSRLYRYNFNLTPQQLAEPRPGQARQDHDETGAAESTDPGVDPNQDPGADHR